MTKKIYAFLISFLFVSIPLIAGAAVFEGGETYTLSAGTVVSENLYVGGADISVGGTVAGDAIGVGGTVVVSGNVRDDVMFAGGNITILGTVGGDARIAGGNIIVGNAIGGDLVAAGGSVKVLDGVTIGKDIMLAGGNVSFAGNAVGDARFAGGRVTITGAVEGDVLVDVEDTLVLGDGARITGSLVYRGKDKSVLDMKEGASVAGEVRFEERAPLVPRKEVTWGILAVLSAFFFGKLLVMIIAALAAVLIFKNLSQTLVDDAIGNFGTNLLRGFIVFVVTPLAAIGLFVTIAGVFIGLLILAAYALFLLIASLYSGIVFGRALHQLFKKQEKIELVWWHALLGVILLAIVKLIPLVGWVVCAVFFFLALGAISNMFYQRVWARR
ncbi:MAG: FapA family protein [Patescibacteria group bacterium]|nr:FapA family protein [Patescibacteria group bacterium]